MPRFTLACACAFALVCLASPCRACDGVVVEATLDEIKIDQNGFVLTFLVSSGLQTNTERSTDVTFGALKIKDVKKGQKISIVYYIHDGRDICTTVYSQAPGAAGVVTDIGSNTITICKDDDNTVVYRVAKELVDNRGPYSPVYPNRFSEVKLGDRLEISCYKDKEDGRMVLCGLDIKKKEGQAR